jgi:hypothetical protein
VAVSELPAYLDRPSLRSRYRNPFFAACESTGTVVAISRSSIRGVWRFRHGGDGNAKHLFDLAAFIVINPAKCRPYPAKQRRDPA